MPTLLKVVDLAKELNISKAKAYLLIKNKQIGSLMIDGSRRIMRVDVDNYLAAQRRKNERE